MERGTREGKEIKEGKGQKRKEGKMETKFWEIRVERERENCGKKKNQDISSTGINFL